jgi:hypothetical protein
VPLLRSVCHHRPCDPRLAATTRARRRLGAAHRFSFHTALLNGRATIPAGATGRVINAPSSFVMSDEVVVDWPVVGTIIHKLDALTCATTFAVAA